MRLLWIDWLKSILISLVVVGHSIQFSDVSFERNWIFRFIYSFHMPLFFFVSGYLSFKSEFSIRELPRKLKRLLLPFFSWAILLLIWRVVAHEMPMSSVGSMVMRCLVRPDMGLWFLWVLAWCLVVLYGICLFSRGGLWKFVVLSVVFLLGSNVLIALTKCNLFAVHLISYYFSYFWGGYVIARWGLLDYIKRPVVFVICGGAFAVFLPYWTWKGDILFMQMIRFPGIASQVYRMIVAWTAICFIAGLFSWRGSRGVQMPTVIGFCGRETLGIYALHSYCLLIGLRLCPSFSLPFRVACESVAMMGLSCAGIILFKKSKWISICLLGAVK